MLFALICAGVAVAYGIGLTVWLLGRPEGNERMQEIARAVQEGAAAYLRRQYMTIAAVSIVPFLLLGFYNKLGLGHGDRLPRRRDPLGRGRVHRHERRRALEPADGGGRTPRAQAGSERRVPRRLGDRHAGRRPGLLGVAGYYWVLTGWFGQLRRTPRSTTSIGLAFGGSLISVFARLGGGIYTKAADVGADLVGKIEAGIPEDDPRNPAVIADNVGDNVGDCAGMAADLFETYAVTAVAVMLLGTQFPSSELALFPLALGGMSILASVIGTFFARVGTDGQRS